MLVKLVVVVTLELTVVGNDGIINTGVKVSNSNVSWWRNGGG